MADNEPWMSDAISSFMKTHLSLILSDMIIAYPDIKLKHRKSLGKRLNGYFVNIYVFFV